MYRIGFEQLAHVPFDTLWDMAKAVPDIVRLRGDRSVYQHVARYVKNEKIRFVLSFHPLFVGGDPFRCSALYTLISHLEQLGSVHYAMGGTGSLVRGLAKLIVGQNNHIRLEAEVAEILVEGGRAKGVRLTDGERIAADVVVSNADVAWTYKHLLPGAQRRKWNDARIDRLAYSNGLFVWYFGTDRCYDDVAHHTISLGPRYRGLIEDIFKHRRLAEDFSLYLYRPSATDPAVAPAGCDSFYALVPVPNLAADVDWRVEAEPFRQRVEATLASTLLPDLGRHVVRSKVATPLDFESRLLSYRGAGFSLEPKLLQSAWFRPHNRSEDVDGLYFVGAGTHPGPGLPGVVSSAKVLDRVVPDARVSV
jgi:phytoene desaturase